MATGDIGNNIRTYLLTISAITDVVSTRIYSDVLPQKASMEAIVYRLINGSTFHHLTGVSEFGDVLLQIDCYGATRGEADALGEIVRKNLAGYSGAAGDDTVNNVIAESRRYRYEPPKDGKGTGRFLYSRDYRIFFSEPAVST